MQGFREDSVTVSVWQQGILNASNSKYTCFISKLYLIYSFHCQLASEPSHTYIQGDSKTTKHFRQFIQYLCVLLTCSLGQFVKDLSQFALNLTNAQYASLVLHGASQSCSPVHPRPFAAYHSRWLTWQSRCFPLFPKGCVEDGLRTRGHWRIHTGYTSLK
jgi:hypothetical protein